MVDVMADVPDDRVRFDIVWSNTIATNTIADAEQQMPVSPDPRARAWWEGAGALSRLLADAVGTVVTYDFYLVYEPGRAWGDDSAGSPGTPDFFMHQVGDLPPELRLDEQTFADAVSARLPGCSSVQAN